MQKRTESMGKNRCNEWMTTIKMMLGTDSSVQKSESKASSAVAVLWIFGMGMKSTESRLG